MNNEMPTRAKLQNFITKKLDKRLHSEVEDLIQETEIAAWNSAHNFKGLSKFSTFVFGIAYKNVLHCNRTFGKRLDLLVSFDENEELFDSLELSQRSCEDASIASEELKNLLGWLESNCKKGFELLTHLINGESCEKMAELTGLPVGTIKSRVSRLRKEALRYCEVEKRG